VTSSVPTADVVAPSSEAGLGSYLAELWRSPAKAKAAVVGCLLLMVVSPSGLSALTTFVVPAYARATGVSIPDGILVFVTLPLLTGPVILPFAGRWVDRWGARRIVIPSAVLYAAATAIVPECGSSAALLAVVLVLVSVFGFMSGLAVVFKVISTWLPGHRGIGFALIGVTSSLSSSVLSPLFQWLVNGDVTVSATAPPKAGGHLPAAAANVFAGFGWRGTYFLVAAVIALVAIPTALLLVSEPEKSGRLEPTAPEQALPPLPGVPIRKALPTRVWIFITLALAFAAAGPMTVRQNAVTFLGERGFSAATVSVSLSALFIASIVGLLVGGLLLDRTDRPWVVVPMLATVPAGLLIALVNHGSLPLLFLAMILLGFATGAESSLGPFLIVRYFGLASFAQLQGLTLAVSTVSLGLAPYLVSAVETSAGSFTVPVLALTALTVVAVVLVALLPRFPQQWKIADLPQEAGESAWRR
jgi:MFS family permease